MKRKKEDIFIEDLVESVKQDFLSRQKERKNFEAIWKLNENFYDGNQFVNINKLSDLVEGVKEYYWQERQVFNHISPIIETRLSKLCSIRPEMDVLPTSTNEDDKKIANLSKDILRSVYEKLNLSDVINKATKWSEITGTSFYKATWNEFAGKKVYTKDGQILFEGEVEITAVSPFEIYPDSNMNENIDDCESIIHAKSYNINEIKNLWHVDILKSDLAENNLKTANDENIKHNQAIVIERYEAPTVECPNGRLVIICEDKLLYIGELPFINRVDNKRGFPFIKQVCECKPGCFWGKSIIEKLIPIQRAYNAIKNRKHEYLNRISMGVLTVEDGSIDTNSLQEEGLQPGKILIYKQGSTPPKFLEEEALSASFDKEEEKLLNEFSDISGVTNILSSSFNSNNLSGNALELLIEQGSTRLSTSIDEIENSVKLLAKMILRLYKQFAVLPRIVRLSNTDNNVAYWKNSDLGLEDIQFISDSAVDESLASKREHLLKLLSSNIFKNEDGVIDDELKQKIMSIFGLNL